MALAKRFVARVQHWIDENEIVVDLGARIGSREWLRGAATCFGLCAIAWSMHPGLTPLPGAQPLPLPDAQWQEARALSISPLAYGADTGSRMGATDAVEMLSETPDRPHIELTAIVGRGDSFQRALTRAGVTDSDAKIATGLVAQLFASHGGSADELIARLRSDARDLGTPGRDRMFGWGLLRLNGCPALGR